MIGELADKSIRFGSYDKTLLSPECFYGKTRLELISSGCFDQRRQTASVCLVHLFSVGKFKAERSVCFRDKSKRVLFVFKFICIKHRKRSEVNTLETLDS